MFNKRVKGIFCLKFLDELILPFVVVSAVRYLGFFAATYLRPIQFSFSSRSDLASAPFLSFNSQAGLLFANSVSWFFISIALAILFGFIIFRNYYFHADWIHPRATFHLHNQNMEFLIVEKMEAYYQAISWAVLTLCLVVFSAVEVLVGQIQLLVFGVFWAIGTFLVCAFLLQVTRDEKLRSKKV